MSSRRLAPDAAGGHDDRRIAARLGGGEALDVRGAHLDPRAVGFQRDLNHGAAFTDAPGDRGTEIRLDIESGGVLSKLSGDDPRAKAMDALRRFKARVETGEEARA